MVHSDKSLGIRAYEEEALSAVDYMMDAHSFGTRKVVCLAL